MHANHSVYTRVYDDATKGTISERNLLSCILFVSSFGDSQSVESSPSTYRHIDLSSTLSSSQEQQAKSCTAPQDEAG